MAAGYRSGLDPDLILERKIIESETGQPNPGEKFRHATLIIFHQKKVAT